MEYEKLKVIENKYYRSLSRFTDYVLSIIDYYRNQIIEIEKGASKNKRGD